MHPEVDRFPGAVPRLLGGEQSSVVAASVGESAETFAGESPLVHRRGYQVTHQVIEDDLGRGPPAPIQDQSGPPDPPRGEPVANLAGRDPLPPLGRPQCRVPVVPVARSPRPGTAQVPYRPRHHRSRRPATRRAAAHRPAGPDVADPGPPAHGAAGLGAEASDVKHRHRRCQARLRLGRFAGA